MHNLLYALVFLAFFYSSCSSGPKLPEDFSEEEGGKGRLETVVIMGINDLHGSLAPQRQKTKEGVEYEKGGASVLASHVFTLRSLFGSHFLLFDAGDQFQGSIESNIDKGKPVVKFYNAIGVNAAAIGNHEFDFGPEPQDSTDYLGVLKARASEATYKYVVSNITDKQTQALFSGTNIIPRMIIESGRLRVGVLGVTTPDTPRITRPAYVQSLQFGNLKKTTMEQAKALREEGAHVVVAIAHAGTTCQTGKQTLQNSFRKPTDARSICNEKEELNKLLRSLPPGTIDAVVSGHTHQLLHHWIHNVPVIQAGTRNQYYNLIFLTYDWTTNRIVNNRTRIQGPIPICKKVFENQQDCNGNRQPPKNGRGKLIWPTLYGKTIKPSSEIDDLLAPVFEKSANEKNRVIGEAEKPIQMDRTRESSLGNLVADAVRASTNADVAIVNPGGIRADFEQGPITYEAIYRALPFDNTVSLLTVTGKELKLIIRIAQNGSRGFFPVSGANLRVIDLPYDAPASDLNGDKKTDAWEVNRLIEVKLSDGRKVKDNEHYKLATIDFIVLGGDDMNWVMSKIPEHNIQLAAAGLIRDVVADYIASRSPINSDKEPLVDKRKSRIKRQKTAKKSGY